MIKKKGQKFCLMSQRDKSLGCYPTKAGAEKREKQVNYFKNKKK